MRKMVIRDTETLEKLPVPATAKELHSHYSAAKTMHEVASPVLGLDSKSPNTVVNIGLLDEDSASIVVETVEV
jgi:hypothetical protein